MISWVSLALLFTILFLVGLAVRIYYLDSESLLYKLAAALMLNGAILSFAEFEISRIPPSAIFPDTLSAFHSSVSLWLISLGTINAFIFANLHWSWPKWARYLVFAFSLLPALVFSILLIGFDFLFIDGVMYGTYTWSYLLEMDSNWDLVWVLWQGLCLLAMLYFWYRSINAARTRRDRVGRLIFFVITAGMATGMMYFFVLGKSMLNSGDYLLSIPVAISIVLMVWVYTNFRLFEITPRQVADTIVNAMSNVLILTDENLIIREINPATIKMFGVGRNLLVGLSIEKISGQLGFDNFETLQASIRNLKAGEQMIRELQLVSPEKKVSLVMTISPALRDGKRIWGYVFLGTDMTPFKQVEAMLLDYTQQLENTNEELERFAYIASHDLKTPVRNISAFLSLIKRRLPKSIEPELQEFLEYAQENSKHAYSMIQDLLEYSTSTQNTPHYVEVSLDSLLSEIHHNLRKSIRQKSALLSWDDLPDVKGDPVQLAQLLQNLIENGLKYNRSTVPEIHISSKTEKSQHIIAIRDNGIGIKKEYQKQIFGLFTRLHTLEEYSGTGIGLAICEKIVKAHAGTIWLESEENSGSTFFFSLPINPQKSHSGAIESPYLREK